MAGLRAEETAADLKQDKKRPRTELTGDEQKEQALAAEVIGNEHNEEALATEVTGHEEKEETEPEGNKRRLCVKFTYEDIFEEEKTTKTSRPRYTPEYVDFILSWDTDWKIPELPVDDEMTEEVRGMNLYAMEYWTELRARKKALKEFVKAQVDERGYAEMPEEAAEPPKYYDEDGEEMVYLGFGMYDD